MLRLLALVTALLVSLPAAAVSCGGQQSAERAYSSAQEVFSAHVDEIYSAPGFGRDDFNFARLRILQVWKGHLGPGDIVSTTADDSISFVSDGFVPLQGTDVLVYTSGAQPFVLGICSGSAPLDRTGDTASLERLSKREHGR